MSLPVTRHPNIKLMYRLIPAPLSNTPPDDTALGTVVTIPSSEAIGNHSTGDDDGSLTKSEESSG